MPPTIRQVGGGNSPEEWFKALPPITKWYLVAAFLSTILTHFGLMSVGTLVWDLESIKRFQVWRLVTPFTFFGGLGMPFVMQLFMLVQYSGRYEANPFNTGGGGSSADYALMLIFGGTCLHIINLYMRAYVMGQSMVSFITYVWSCRDPNTIVSMWGFTLQAMYLPWALLLLSFLMQGTQGLITPALGMAVGHLYYFVIDVLPFEYDIDILRTPKALQDLFAVPPASATGGVQMHAPAGGAAAAGGSRVGSAGGGATGGGGYNWGSGGGRVLGSS